MKSIKKQILSVLVTSAVLLQAAVPAFANTSIIVSGNGSDTENTPTVTNTRTVNVIQGNNAVVTNTVHANSNTGLNTVSDNTNGDVMLRTGNATTAVDVRNTLNTNVAQVDCCPGSDATVTISGNGTDSENKATLNQTSTTGLFQNNRAQVENKVDANASTGLNSADDNTGGDTVLWTGDAQTTANVSTTANANSAQVGGNGQAGGSVDLRILNNGSDTENTITATLSRDVSVVQDNIARVKNQVDADAGTGLNSASGTTGGSVTLLTGDATTDVTVDTTVNLNWANVDCGCFEDVLAKAVGNGTDSENKIRATLADDLAVFQGGHENGNNANVQNRLNGDAGTGLNALTDSTGGVITDPTLWTGDAFTSVTGNTTGNANVYGADASGVTWPTFDFSFNLSSLLGH